MGFVLKIYFIGLIAFVPSQDGREMTALLLDARQGYAVSDGTLIDAHTPLLAVRAGSCAGPCRDDTQQVADFLYQAAKVADPAESLRQLKSALGGGGAWMLDGSDLTLELPAEAGLQRAPGLEIIGSGRSKNPGLLPGGPDETRDFAWIASLGRLDPSAGTVDPDVVAPRPEKGLIVARLRLDQGRIGTHRLVAYEDRVVPLAFETLRGKTRADYSQALADWVMAEVKVPGCSVRLVEKSFLGDGKSRVLELAPERCDGNDEIELVLVNSPASDPAHSGQSPEKVGKHFEMYYELAYLRPPNRLRPVPVLTEEPGMEKALALRQEAGSQFLRALGLQWRGLISRPICPTVFFDGVAGGQ